MCRKTINISAPKNNSEEKPNIDKLINPYGIQCLQPDLKEKVFGKTFAAETFTTNNDPDKQDFQGFKTKVLKEICDKSLENFQLKGKSTSRFDPVNIKDFPDLEGPDLDTHFLKIGKYLAEPYTKIIDEALEEECKTERINISKMEENSIVEKKLKTLPTEWLIEEGWVKYSLYDDQPPLKVDYPAEKFLTFDVETLPKISNYPVMATAKSINNIYCWLSPSLIKAYHHYTDNAHLEQEYLKKWKEEKMEHVPLLEAVLKYEDRLEEIQEKLETSQKERLHFEKVLIQHQTVLRLLVEKVGIIEKKLEETVNTPPNLVEITTREEYILEAMAKDKELSKREASKAYTELKTTISKQNSELKKVYKANIRDKKAELKDIQAEANAKTKEVYRYEIVVKNIDLKISKLEDNKLKKQGQIQNAKKENYDKMMEKLDKEAAGLDINPADLSQSIIQHLCPVNPTNEQKVIVGHNVSYDRARILEEYNYNQTNNFFMDTLSLHVAVSGMCSKQRLLYFHHKKASKMSKMEAQEFLEKEGLDDFTDLSGQTFEDYQEEVEKNRSVAEAVQSENPWISKTSMNSLKECSKFYLDYEADKEIRDVFFVSKTYKPVVDDLQNLITYCASDTILTEEVFKNVYPEFQKRLPHPVSTAALKSMGQSFLPVNSTKWNNYIDTCENMYLKYTEEIQQRINAIIEDLLAQYEEDKYFWTNDPWLAQLDWEQIPLNPRKDGTFNIVHNRYAQKPAWYKSICKKPNVIGTTVSSKLIPIFFKLKYLNKPVIFEDIWMDKDFVISKRMNSLSQNQIKKYFNMTEEQLDSLKEGSQTSISDEENAEEVSDNPQPNAFFSSRFALGFIEKNVDISSLKLMSCLCIDVEDPEEIDLLLKKKNHRLTTTPTASGRGKRFLILHPDDEFKRVTRLVSKAFKPHFDSGKISSELPLAKEALDIVTKCSYWVSNRKRIMSQWVLTKNDLSTSNDSNQFIKDNMLQTNRFFSKDEQFGEHDGMILPGLITMGTVTRRAVENTWLTASNVKPKRLGSELKSVVQAPEGYCFVGADVDSEELWIGSLIADSLYENHGSTPLGWMTLEGSKKEGTDMHTTTAKILNTSRDNAKIFNYSRIYGAGKKFTAQLLKKLDPDQSTASCKETTENLYLRTKGRRNFDAHIYYGGSESALFTKLTEIAEEEDCRTPVLKAKITECLTAENNTRGNYITSRINWIIQSSGVDYLHLLITSMEYLIKKYNINARLVISIHDEIRFICKEEDKYKTAMALQISNIWTRAMFCQSLHIDDLPQSCAFFSGVDIDKVLRKEVDIDCVTVSNPKAIPPGEVFDIYGLIKKIGNTLTTNENKEFSLDDIKVDDIYKELKGLGYKKTDTIIDLIKLTAINEEDESSLDNFLKEMSSGAYSHIALTNKLSSIILGTSKEDR